MAANVPDATRLLSIQSHVVSGYVGMSVSLELALSPLVAAES